MEMENKNVFSELQRLTSKDKAKKDFTYEDLSKALETVIIENLFEGFIDHPLKKSFFDGNDELIIESIKSNKILNEAIEELSKIYSYTDEESIESKTNPVFHYIVLSTEGFIKSLVKTFLSLEIDYLIHLKELYKNSDQKTIRGKLLNFYLKKETTTVNENSLNNLLDKIGMIVEHYSLLLRMKNSEWCKAMSDNHSEHVLNIARLIHYITKLTSGTAKNNSKGKNPETKNNVGRPGKFRTQSELHNKILSLPDWENLIKNKTQLAKALGYRRSNGLNELLKNREWSLPE